MQGLRQKNGNSDKAIQMIRLARALAFVFYLSKLVICKDVLVFFPNVSRSARRIIVWSMISGLKGTSLRVKFLSA